MNPALQGYLAAMEESLAEAGALGRPRPSCRPWPQLIETSNELALAINDGSVPVASRRAVLDDLLDGKVRPEVASLVHQAVTVVPASEVEAPSLAVRPDPDRRPSTARRRAGGRGRGSSAAWARATGSPATPPPCSRSVTVADLEEIEDQLFRFARTVESSRPLRHALGDRDLPVALAPEVIADLFGDQVLPATRRLAAYAVRGGRARDIVATLDVLVEAAALARGWRVAHVQAADQVGEQRQALSEALARLAGNPVELQVTIEPELLGGVVVQVGDLLVDGGARHRFDELKEHLLVSEAAYQIPEGRKRADG